MDFNAARNIRFDNNDDDEEEAQIGNDEEEDEGEDEPDFMDNSGKCWEFGCKIEDEKHLKEWCQNKMGGMIVGKEEKLTRQFNCPNKECQFKAIFLKACSIVYTRNNHNHGVKNGKNILQKKEKEKANPPSAASANERNYVDIFGKTWPFHAYIGKNISQNIFHTKYGFTAIHKNNKNLNLRCQKTNPAGGRCPFAGIYLMTNGCLYTRGEHKHKKKEKTPPNIGDNYVDNLGNIWKFNKEIGKRIKREIFFNKFGFHTMQKNKKNLYLRCQKINRATGEMCKFAGIYLKSNGYLYTREKHNHEQIEKNPKPNDGDDYVDIFGKKWPFHAKISKKIPKDILRSKFGFSAVQQNVKTLNLFCQKRTINGGKCPCAGIYLMSNECLYIRGKHEHK